MKNYHNLLWLFVFAIGCTATEQAADDGGFVVDASDASAERASLIQQEDWKQTPFADDPFSPPENPICDPTSGIGTESLDGEKTIAILTDFCPWATVEQLTLVNLKMGDELNFRVWHFELTGEGPAQIKIKIGDWIALDLQIEKPHKAQLIAKTITVPREIPRGSTVYFHVDNHGANEYSLVELSKN